jgi:hypothetical protein
MGPCKEAFTRFVILTELLHYHNEDLRILSDKYQALLSFPNDQDIYDNYTEISNVLDQYKGKICLTKLEKGFRDEDIRFFISIRA